MIREAVIGALLGRLTSPPLVYNFTASTATGSTTLGGVSSTSGLMVGMPVTGDGLPGNAVITAITPAVTVSLPAIADRTASPMTQGFQTVLRRQIDPYAEQDMPYLCLIELGEMHPERGSNEAFLIDLNCEAWIWTKVGADPGAIPAATLNMLIDGIEAALYPTPTGYRQTLGLDDVLFCRIEGEVTKDPGNNGQLAGAIIPLRIRVKLVG